MNRLPNHQAIGYEKTPTNSQKGSKKGEMNSTPIKTRNSNNKENDLQLKNQGNNIPVGHCFKSTPNNSSLSEHNAKTIPKNKIAAIDKRCVNHHDLQAEFRISIQTQFIHYCSKCAINLASNGFHVAKIHSKPTKLQRQVRPPTSKKRQELQSFLQNLSKLSKELRTKGDEAEEIKRNYKSQKQTIFNFYNGIYEYISKVRDEHFDFLTNESERNIQICEIEADEVGQTLEEIVGISTDIQNNMEKIIEDVQDSSYMECMSYYHQKKNIYDHRLQEIGCEAKAANCTTAHCIEDKLTQFKMFIDDITGILSSKASELDY